MVLNSRVLYYLRVIKLIEGGCFPTDSDISGCDRPKGARVIILKGH